MNTFKEALAQAIINNQFTPDIITLERIWAYIPVFVYGNTKKGMDSHALMCGFPCLGKAVTVSDNYLMFCCANEPVIFDSTSKDKRAVAGELYMVPPCIIKDLDTHYCRGLHFRQQMSPVFYKDAVTKQCSKAPAFLYVGISNAWDRWMQSNPTVTDVYFDDFFPNKYAFKFVSKPALGGRVVI